MNQSLYSRKIIQKNIRIRSSTQKIKDNELRDSIKEELMNKEEFELLKDKKPIAENPIASYMSAFPNVLSTSKQRKKSEPKPIVEKKIRIKKPTVVLSCNQVDCFDLIPLKGEADILTISKEYIDYSNNNNGNDDNDTNNQQLKFNELYVETLDTGRSYTSKNEVVQNTKCETEPNEVVNQNKTINQINKDMNKNKNLNANTNFLAISNQSLDSFKVIDYADNSNTDSNFNTQRNRNNDRNTKRGTNATKLTKKNKKGNQLLKGASNLSKKNQNSLFDKEFQLAKQKGKEKPTNSLLSESNDQPSFQAKFIQSKKKKIKNTLNNLYLLNIDKDNKNMSKIHLEDIHNEAYAQSHQLSSMWNQSYSRLIPPMNTKTNCSLITSSDKAYTMYNVSMGIGKKLLESNTQSLINTSCLPHKDSQQYIH